MEEEAGTSCKSRIDIYPRPCVKQIAGGKLRITQGDPFGAL